MCFHLVMELAELEFALNDMAVLVKSARLNLFTSDSAPCFGKLVHAWNACSVLQMNLQERSTQIQ